MKETLWQRLTRGARRLWSRDEWDAVQDPAWADAVMQKPVTDRFHAKQGRSTGRLVQQELVVYIKRHYKLPFWTAWLATMFPDAGWSPAMQEARHLNWAHDIGVPVPDVLAVGEFIGPAGKLQSFLAVRELTGMLPLNEAIPQAEANLSPAEFAEWKRTLTHEVARLSGLLHQHAYFHKDLYLCHFYIARSDTAALPAWRDRVFLIDLHRLGHHRLTWPIYQTKDLAQLLYSSMISGVTARDRLRFWKAYRGKQRGGVWAWLLRRVVLLRLRRYRDHNERARESSAARPPGRWDVPGAPLSRSLEHTDVRAS